MIWLSPNFSLEEMTVTDNRNFIPLNRDMAMNNKDIFASLQKLCLTILQPIRDYFKYPVIITSGYRCLGLNEVVGSSPSSQHIKGEAADFRVSGTELRDVFNWIKNSNIPFGQLILEFNAWVHISLPRTGKKNREVLVAYRDELGNIQFDEV